jgi:hypothetical protein
MAKPSTKLSTRQVTARFWENAELADLERESGIRNLRLTMIGLWAAADEAGIFGWEPRRLSVKIYPYNSEDQQAVEPAMQAFLEAGFLKKVAVGGSCYGYWPNWGAHNDFRKTNSRYPEVQAALGIAPTKIPENPGRGTQTPEAPGNPAEIEREVEKEGEGFLTECLTIEERAPGGIGQETQTSLAADEGSEVPARPAPQASGGAPAAQERLARLLFKLLDQPREHMKNAGLWQSQVAALLNEKHSLEEIAAVMEFAVKDNDFSAEYLTLAKEPMKSFVKNYDQLFKRWKALQKGAAAAANRAAKLAKPTTTAPGSHANRSGMEL